MVKRYQKAGATQEEKSKKNCASREEAIVGTI
jgi:hypothetical protein